MIGAVSVVLAEDHALVRAGIRGLVEQMPGVRVVGEAADGREAIDVVAATNPDIVLMDISMPRLNGVEAVAQLSVDRPRTRVIMLSMHQGEEFVWRALQAGAAGYVLKDAGPSELELAIQSVARGGSYLGPTASRHVTEYVRRGALAGPGPVGRLTTRQVEVVQLIAEGHTNLEISGILGVSLKTVETHRAQVMDRLGIHDVAGLVRYAIRTGLVSSEH